MNVIFLFTQFLIVAISLKHLLLCYLWFGQNHKEGNETASECEKIIKSKEREWGKIPFLSTFSHFSFYFARPFPTSPHFFAPQGRSFARSLVRSLPGKWKGNICSAG